MGRIKHRYKAPHAPPHSKHSVRSTKYPKRSTTTERAAERLPSRALKRTLANFRDRP